MRENNIRKTKADKVDTYIICKTLMMQDALSFVIFYNLDLKDLKALGHCVGKLVRIIWKVFTDEVEFNLE